MVGASVDRVVGAVGVVALSVGVELGFAVALTEDADAADADCSLACAETPACEITLGVEPATSCPTRLTAVSVTAVTNAHDITQPSANARGRPVQPRSARMTRARASAMSSTGTSSVASSGVDT